MNLSYSPICSAAPGTSCSSEGAQFDCTGGGGGGTESPASGTALGCEEAIVDPRSVDMRDPAPPSEEGWELGVGEVTSTPSMGPPGPGRGRAEEGL